MKIKECVIYDDDPELGAETLSYVYEPAFEEYFVAMDRQNLALSEYFQYTAYPEPETIDTSHEFCKEHAGKIYHINEIKNWSNLVNTQPGFITESDFFATFDGNVRNYNCDQQLYNCRHYLKRVANPFEKQEKFFKTNLMCDFKFDAEKREVSGLALKSGKLIYRRDVQGEPGYIYFSRDTIRKIYEKYKYNRSINIAHDGVDRTGHIIVLKSWLEENDDKNETSWFVKHKVINDELWDMIKNGSVRGFSMEINVALK
jgi:hypothetical protein